MACLPERQELVPHPFLTPIFLSKWLSPNHADFHPWHLSQRRKELDFLHVYRKPVLETLFREALPFRNLKMRACKEKMRFKSLVGAGQHFVV